MVLSEREYNAHCHDLAGELARRAPEVQWRVVRSVEREIHFRTQGHDPEAAVQRRLVGHPFDLIEVVAVHSVGERKAESTCMVSAELLLNLGIQEVAGLVVHGQRSGIETFVRRSGGK